ncbi:aminotransferase class V-fold PLP-dependent enzyme, partial [bacterium]|nr:aminotransferase class V-fold PLP-dependent enzyme [bacterium]
IKKEIAEKMEPYQVGGAMVHSVGLESSKWKLSPQKFEAGTPPIVQVLGLGAAIDFFESEVNFGEVHKHVDGLSNKLRQHLIDLPGVTLLSLRGSIVSFSIHGIHAHDVAAFLGDAGVFVRAGHHCAQPLHAELGIESSVRASFFLYNNEGDVERAIGAIDRCIAFFNGGV